MTTLKGKDLDDFFRKQLSNGEIPFDEANWIRLEKRLKKNNRKRMVTWMSLSGIAAMLVIGLSVNYILLNKKPDNLEISTIKKPSDAGIPHMNGQFEKSTESGETVETRQGKDSTGIPGADISYNHPAEKKIQDISPAVATNKKPADGAADTPSAALPRVESVAKNPDTSDAATPFEALATANEPAVTMNNATVTADIEKKDRLSKSIEGSTRAASRFSLSLFAGPDINGVNNLRSNRGGISAGLLFGYKLSKSLNITTGAVYAKKLYDSEFDYYKPNSSYKFPVAPTMVNADCRVLDIPININYTAWSGARNAIGITAGISSYLMLNEHYSFTYADPSVRGPKTYYITNRNKHYLGIINLAAAYERKVTNEISIGIQPYFKLPVTDIGYGNVKLISTGIITSVQLNLPSKDR